MDVPFFSKAISATGSHHLVSVFVLDADGRAGQLSQKELEAAYRKAQQRGTDHQLAIIDRRGFAAKDGGNVIRFNSKADAVEFFNSRLKDPEPETMTFNIEDWLPMVIATKDWPVVAQHAATPVGTNSEVMFTVRQCQTGPEECLGQYLLYACPAQGGDIPVPETYTADRCRELCLVPSVKKMIKRWSCRASDAQKLLNAMPPVPVVEKPLWKPLELPEGMMEQIVERAVGEVRDILTKALFGEHMHPAYQMKGTTTGRHTSTKSNCEEVPKKETQPSIARRKASAFLLLDAPEVRSLPLDKLLASIENIVSLLHEYRTEAGVMAYGLADQTAAIQMIVDLDEVKTRLNELAEQRAKSVAGAGVSEQLAQAYQDMDSVLREFIILQMPTIASRLKLE